MDELEDKDISLKLIAKMVMRSRTLIDEKLSGIVEQNKILSQKNDELSQKITELEEKISAKQEEDKEEIIKIIWRAEGIVRKDLEKLNKNLLVVNKNLTIVDNNLSSDIKKSETTIMNKLRGLGSGIASEISASNRRGLI